MQDHEQPNTEMAATKIKKQHSAYEAPSVKEFLWVIIAFAILIALSWIAYFELGWFH
jgi:hypothetical protein